MKLILEYDIGDGCTYGCTETVPINYESAEALIVDFEEKCKAAKKEWEFPTGTYRYVFEIGGQTFDFTNFFVKEEYFSPRIFTVDEWFIHYGQEVTQEPVGTYEGIFHLPASMNDGKGYGIIKKSKFIPLGAKLYMEPVL